MENRFQPIPPADQTDEQKKAHNMMKVVSGRSFDTSTFKLEDERGALLGPWGFMM